MSPVSQVIPMLKSPSETSVSLGISLTWRALTHRGLVRMRNEDKLYIDKAGNEPRQRFLFAIADGLGGHRGGAVASQTAIKTVKDEFRKWRGGGAENFANKTLRSANEDVFAIAQVTPVYFSMRTTLTAIVLEQDSLAFGHVGDCRLYRYREGTLKQLTRDHTAVNDLARLRLISTENLAHHPNRHHLTQALGNDPFLRPDKYHSKIMLGDSYLLCSDGLWSEVTTEEIECAMADNDITAGFEELIGKVLDAGAPDNVSGVLFRVSDTVKTSRNNN